ncbi:MAG: alpha/beta hydrolase [Deferribacterota bacterium]|nr:alpha/beta hydrolase [Deferribacterota bacterium]
MIKKSVYLFMFVLFFILNLNAQNITHKDGYFTGQLNDKIYYQYWQVENPKAILVIAHGFGEHSGRYIEMADHYTKLGLSVYALDHRGHGRSEGDRWNVEDFDFFLDDLHYYIGNVVRKLENNNRKLFLLGHSMGGEIAAKHALVYPEDFDYLILSSPSVGAYLAGIAVPQFVNTLTGALGPIVSNVDFIGSFPMPGTQIPPEYLSHDPSVVEAYVNDPLVCHEAIKMRMSVELSQNMSYIQRNADETNSPILVMYGTEDMVVPPNDIISYYDKLEVEDKTLKGFEGFYHEIFNEIGKEEVYKTADKWILDRIN